MSTKINRRMVLERILRGETDEQRPLTIKQMQLRLQNEGIDAERRTLYRDIEGFLELDLDIVKVEGNPPKYYMSSRDFELTELLLLSDAVQSSRFITAKKSAKLIEKLSMLAEPSARAMLTRQIYVSGRIKTMNESIYYIVDEIERAISLDRDISFTYMEYGMDKKLRPRRAGERYNVSPYLLCWSEENYYLVAYNPHHESLSHFRVDKMGSVEISEQPRRPSQISPAEYAKGVFSMFAGDRRLVRVKLDTSLLGVVIDRFGQDVALSAAGENAFIAELRVAISPAFFSWLFQCGGLAQIVYPDDVADEFRHMLRSVQALY